MPAKYQDRRRSHDRPRGRPGPNRYPTPGLDGHRRAVTPLFASTMTNGEVKLRSARLPLRKLGLVSELCRLIASKWRILKHEILTLPLYFKPKSDIMASSTLSRPLHILTASVTHSYISEI